MEGFDNVNPAKRCQLQHVKIFSSVYRFEASFERRGPFRGPARDSQPKPIGRLLLQLVDEQRGDIRDTQPTFIEAIDEEVQKACAGCPPGVPITVEEVVEETLLAAIGFQ